jgi:hypothetical protein
MAYSPSLGDYLFTNANYFHDDVTMPNNTSANGNVLDISTGGVNSYVAIIGLVSATIALADTKVLSFKVQDSADGTTWTGGLDVTVKSITASGATTLTKDQKQQKSLFEYVLPRNCRRYVRVVATTTDTQQSGKFTVGLVATI